MHAVVFTVDMKEGWEGSTDDELDQVVTLNTSAPGLVRGTWTTDGGTGLSFLLFDSEDSARRVADNAALPPDAGVALRSVNVYEVVREA